jgi:hypothetical protein
MNASPRALFASLLFPLCAHADPILVVNPGFEDISGENVFNEFTFGPLNGWGLYDPGAITNGGAGNTYFIGTLTPFESSPGVYEYFPDGAPEGERVGIAFNFNGSGGAGEYGFQQTLGATLQANTTYTLQVLVGNIASGVSIDETSYDLRGFPGYRIDLMAGGVVLESDNNTLAGFLPEGDWGLSTVTFTTGSDNAQLGQALGIRLVNLNQTASVPTGADLEVDFDNVTLTANAVPEPAGAALLLAGGILLGRRFLRLR